MKGILGEVDNTGWSQGSGTSGGLDATVHPVEHMGLAELGQVEGGHRPLGVTNVSRGHWLPLAPWAELQTAVCRRLGGGSPLPASPLGSGHGHCCICFLVPRHCKGPSEEDRVHRSREAQASW